MISVLVTRADSRAELQAEWVSWMRAHQAPPALILGHRDLPFAFPEQSDSEQTVFNGVRVLTLDDFILVHEDDLDPDDDERSERQVAAESTTAQQLAAMSATAGVWEKTALRLWSLLSKVQQQAAGVSWPEVPRLVRAALQTGKAKR